MSTIIEIEPEENAVDNRKLTVIHDSFHNDKTGKWDGICAMDIRLSDFESEGHDVFISFWDTIFERTGDYIPINLEKEELKKVIDFMQECYAKLP